LAQSKKDKKDNVQATETPGDHKTSETRQKTENAGTEITAKPPVAGFSIVGIGASAGGLAAMTSSV
jgi:chemotaxis response regulator CheB